MQNLPMGAGVEACSFNPTLKSCLELDGPLPPVVRYRMVTESYWLHGADAKRGLPMENEPEGRD